MQVVLEVMPEWIRGSHRTAGNWGCYPHNGAVRYVADAIDAKECVESDMDGYNSIVRVSRPSDDYPAWTGLET